MVDPPGAGEVRGDTMSLSRLLRPVIGALALVALGCVPDPGTPGGTTTTTIQPGPTAIASATPTVGDAPLTVGFDSSGSYLGTGSGLTYIWDFGDGSPAGSGPTTNHTYANPGNYVAYLTITTSNGTSTAPGIAITVNVDPQVLRPNHREHRRGLRAQGHPLLLDHRGADQRGGQRHPRHPGRRRFVHGRVVDGLEHGDQRRLAPGLQ
jgi:hypothetical protein